MAALSSGSRASRSGSGQSTRWTESGESGSTETTSPCHSSSAVNGAYGASSRVTVRRQVQRSSAASASLPVPRQNRRRDSRTYQFDRSSTNAASRRAALVAVVVVQVSGDLLDGVGQLGQDPARQVRACPVAGLASSRDRVEPCEMSVEAEEAVGVPGA